MAAPNFQLEAAIRRFGAQPGVTAAQEAQLRAAVAADVDHLTLLNSQAASGQIRGFALEVSSATQIGTYDKRSGMVSLPAASFAGAGNGANADLRAVVGIQALSVDFGDKTWQDAAGTSQPVSQDMVSNLQATLNGSPVLANQVKGAVLQKHVEHFSLLPNGMAAGATYDGTTLDGTPKGINLPAVRLQSKTAANPHGRYDAIDMTFVLGHEVQHGFNNAAKQAATSQFLQDVVVQEKVKSHTHDYSDELRAYLKAGREDEAKAEIAGWNALLSLQRQTDSKGNGLDLMLGTRNARVFDFIEADAVNAK